MPEIETIYSLEREGAGKGRRTREEEREQIKKETYFKRGKIQKDPAPLKDRQTEQTHQKELPV